MDFLKVSGVSKKHGENFVLKDIQLDQQQLQNIAIAGETGSGKSTLLKIIGGIIPPDEGAVYFEGERIKKVPDEKLLPGHPGIAYLSQHFELRNHYRVEELLGYANTFSDEDAATLYDVCRISHLLKRRTNQLSGGEKQRIAMARLLLSAPKLLLLDEPYSNLDIIHKNILKAVIRDVGERMKVSCIIVSHDPLDTLSWADEVIIMKDGKFIQRGSPEQVYRQPVDEYAAGLFGAYNLISPAVAKNFPGLSGIDTHGQDLFIRPEYFKLVHKNESGVKGTIHKVLFYGSYYEVEVQLPDQLITVKTTTGDKLKGDTVYVAVAL